MPQEIIVYMAQFMPPMDVRAILSTCAEIHDYDSEYLWKTVYYAQLSHLGLTGDFTGKYSRICDLVRVLRATMLLPTNCNMFAIFRKYSDILGTAQNMCKLFGVTELPSVWKFTRYMARRHAFWQLYDSLLADPAVPEWFIALRDYDDNDEDRFILTVNMLAYVSRVAEFQLLQDDDDETIDANDETIDAIDANDETIDANDETIDTNDDTNDETVDDNENTFGDESDNDQFDDESDDIIDVYDHIQVLIGNIEDKIQDHPTVIHPKIKSGLSFCWDLCPRHLTSDGKFKRETITEQFYEIIGNNCIRSLPDYVMMLRTIINGNAKLSEYRNSDVVGSMLENFSLLCTDLHGFCVAVLRLMDQNRIRDMEFQDFADSIIALDEMYTLFSLCAAFCADDPVAYRIKSMNNVLNGTVSIW